MGWGRGEAGWEAAGGMALEPVRPAGRVKEGRQQGDRGGEERALGREMRGESGIGEKEGKEGGERGGISGRKRRAVLEKKGGAGDGWPAHLTAWRMQSHDGTHHHRLVESERSIRGQSQVRLDQGHSIILETE